MKAIKLTSQQLKSSFMASARRRSRHSIISKIKDSHLPVSDSLSSLFAQWGCTPETEDASICSLLQRIEANLLQCPTFEVSCNPAHEPGAICEQLQKHTNLWRFLNRELISQKASERLRQNLWQFMVQYIRTNKFATIFSVSWEYGRQIVEALLYCAASTPVAFHEEIIQWVTSHEGLELIHRYLKDKFLPVSQFPNLYSSIEKSLVKGNSHQVSYSCMILTKIFKHADYMDIYHVYQSHSQIMVGLMVQALRHEVSLRRQIKQVIIYLLDTYDCVLVEYAKMGLAALICQLLCPKQSSGDEESQVIALDLLEALSRAHRPEVLDFFLKERQVTEYGFWRQFSGENSLLLSRNIIIRRAAHKIMDNFATSATIEQAAEMANDLESVERGNILDHLKRIFAEEDDPEILESSLSILNNYLQLNSESESQGEPFLEMCHELGLGELVNELKSHPNSRVGSTALRVLGLLDC